MGVTAVGAYLRTLRESRGLTAMDVVAAILREEPDLQPRPTPGHISKIENGTIGSPGLWIITAITRALGGNPAHVSWLILDRAAPATRGRELAAEWLALSSEVRAELAAMMNSGPPPFLREITKKLQGLLEEDESVERSDELPPELLKFVQTPEGRAALLRALRDL